MKPEGVEPLSRDEKNGWILEDGKRIISFRVKTFQSFTDSLNRTVGSKVASALLYQMGISIGQAGMRYSKDRIRADSDLGSVLDSVLCARGWGRCVNMERKQKAGKAVYSFAVKGCPLCHERNDTAPICHVLRGIVAGWVEAFLDKKAGESIERECVATGGRFCAFEVIF